MLKNATPLMQNRHFAAQDGAKTGPRWAKLVLRSHLKASWVVFLRRCEEDVVLSRLKNRLGASCRDELSPGVVGEGGPEEGGGR